MSYYLSWELGGLFWSNHPVIFLFHTREYNPRQRKVIFNYSIVIMNNREIMIKFNYSFLFLFIVNLYFQFSTNFFSRGLETYSQWYRPGVGRRIIFHRQAYIRRIPATMRFPIPIFRSIPIPYLPLISFKNS